MAALYHARRAALSAFHAGLSVDAIAARAGVSPAAVRHLIDGTTAHRGPGRVTGATAEKIVAALGKAEAQP